MNSDELPAATACDSPDLLWRKEMESLLFGAMLLGAAVAYLVPALIASRRKHRNANAIFIINLFFGWTFLGWVVSLAWALTSNTEQAGRMEAPARN